MSAIEKIRVAIAGTVKPPFVVTERRTQYFCDEDSAAVV